MWAQGHRLLRKRDQKDVNDEGLSLGRWKGISNKCKGIMQKGAILKLTLLRLRIQFTSRIYIKNVPTRTLIMDDVLDHRLIFGKMKSISEKMQETCVMNQGSHCKETVLLGHF